MKWQPRFIRVAGILPSLRVATSEFNYKHPPFTWGVTGVFIRTRKTPRRDWVSVERFAKMAMEYPSTVLVSGARRAGPAFAVNYRRVESFGAVTYTFTFHGAAKLGWKR